MTNDDTRFGPQDAPRRDHAGTDTDPRIGTEAERHDEHQGPDHGAHAGHKWGMMGGMGGMGGHGLGGGDRS